MVESCALLLILRVREGGLSVCRHGGAWGRGGRPPPFEFGGG